jgi:hypothetical protein
MWLDASGHRRRESDFQVLLPTRTMRLVSTIVYLFFWLFRR